METVFLATIWPRDPHGRSEAFVLGELLREYGARARDWALRVVVASAHQSALEVARGVMAGFPHIRADFWWMETEHAGTRPEEISFCKEQLPLRLAAEPGWDWLFFYDADVWTRFAQVPEWMGIIGWEWERCFVKIKYTLRDKLEAPAHTLGAYFHHRALLERLEYWKVIFPRHPDGRRRNAPDCALHGFLERTGCRKVVPEDMATLHFTDARNARAFAGGLCSNAPNVRDETGAWTGGAPPVLTPEWERLDAPPDGIPDAAAQVEYIHLVPYSQSGNLADAYNDAIAAVGKTVEWILITDADVMLLTPRYGHLIAQVIAANPGAGLLTCVTNRIGPTCQRAAEVPKETSDLRKLRTAAVARWSKYGTAVTQVEAPCSGFFLLFRRAVWRAVGGFKGRGLLGVDWRFSREVAAAGLPILRMDGLLAVHFYRLDGGSKPASAGMPQGRPATIPATATEPMSTVAVLTRVYGGELPYLSSFVRHYTAIGVTAFYILINDARDATAIRGHGTFTGCNCKFIVNDLVSNDDSWSFNLSANFNLALPHVTEDYLLNVDVDEFLDVSKYAGIQGLIRAHPSPVYRFRWLLANNDGICDPALAFQGVAAKQMCRTDYIKNIHCHDFDLNRKVPHKSIFTEYLLIHYWGRSFRDVVIKTVSQVNLRNAKNGSLPKLKGCGSPGDLPGRFKAMAAMSRVEKTIPVPGFVGIDTVLEEQIVRSFLDEKREAALFGHYRQYRDSLDYGNQVSLFAERKTGINDYLRLQSAQ